MNMNTLKFEPEGWNNEITKVDKSNLKTYMESNETLQGLVKNCDDNYNLYVNFKRYGRIICIAITIINKSTGNNLNAGFS